MQSKQDKMTSILEEKQNLLLNRKEIILEITAEKTPSHSEVQKIVSEKFKANQDALKIKKIEGQFGSNVFKIMANIYPSKKEKEETEFKTKKEKEAEAKALDEAKKAKAEAKKKAEEAKKEAEKSSSEKIEEKNEGMQND